MVNDFCELSTGGAIKMTVVAKAQGVLVAGHSTDVVVAEFGLLHGGHRSRSQMFATSASVKMLAPLALQVQWYAEIKCRCAYHQERFLELQRSKKSR